MSSQGDIDMTLLRYDGKYEDMVGENRQWTIVSSFVDANGCERIRGSFGLEGLLQIGLIKGDDYDE